MEKDEEKNTKENKGKNNTENIEKNKIKKQEGKKKEEQEIEQKNEKIDAKNNSKELIEPEKLKTEELETIKKEIKNTKKRNKLSKKKQIKYKEILKNLIIACVIMLYYLVLIIGMNKVSIIQYITTLKIVIMFEAIIGIALFEIAYKKDDFQYASYGIEMLAIGITTTFVLDLIGKQSNAIKLALAIIVSGFIAYYLIKILILSIRKKSEKKSGNI